MADELTEETQKVIESVEALKGITDPVKRAAAISELLKFIEKNEGEWRDDRREVVLALRAQDVPYRKIAAMIKTSLGTVQAIVRGHAGAWRTKPRTMSEAPQDESDGDAATG